jgi:AcrR family transcriptional regulator
VAASEQMGRLGHRRRNRLVVAARRLLLARTPTSVSLRRMARAADWQPPSIRPRAGTPSEARDR